MVGGVVNGVVAITRPERSSGTMGMGMFFIPGGCLPAGRARGQTTRGRVLWRG